MPAARLAVLALRCALLLLAATAPFRPATAQAALPPGQDAKACALLWQITAVPGDTADAALQLQLGLRFVADRRTRTGLHLPGGWSGLVEVPATAGAVPRAQPRPGEPAWREVAHAPGETVQLQWLLQPAIDAADGGHVQTTAGWFAFSGRGVLPMPETGDASAGPACVAMQGPGPGARWASSHGTADGAGALWVLGPSPVPLAQRLQQALYAGGALQWQAAPGVVAVLPDPPPWPVTPDALAQAGTRAVAAQQRQWPEPPGPALLQPWLLLALPAGAAPPRGNGLASAWHQALALQLPPGWDGGGAGLQALLTEALASAWTGERFGPLAHAGRGDAALRAWFSDGWAGFLAHRSLVRGGLWTPDDYAATLNARIAAYLAEPARDLPNALVATGSMGSPQLAVLQAMRGEWLALHWHLALLRAGHPGLEALLRQQLVPTAQARHEGPISAPLATHRVVAALRGVLQDQPLRDLQQHIEQGQPFEFHAGSLGPCFAADRGADRAAAPVFRPVADALQQPACQAWLGGGPLGDAAALPARTRAEGAQRAGSRQAVRQGGAKAATKAAARSGSKAAKPGPRAATKAAKKARAPRPAR